MPNVKIPIHNRNVNTRKKNLKNWKISFEDKTDLIKFLSDLELGKVNKGIKISAGRQLKYLDLLKIPLEFFKKPISKITLKDMESFEKALSSNRLKTRKKAPFTIDTKVSIRRALKIYLKWKIGETDEYHKLTDWLDLRVPEKTPDYLSEQEIIKLYKKCKSNEERFLIAVLFDAGCRAEEFMNIRYEDIFLPKNSDNFVKIAFKEEYSKTKGRTISLYWKYSNEAVRDYLDERVKEGIKSKDAVFTKTYDATRTFLGRLGKKVLNKSIYFHLFRHSSSTHYASQLNRQQLCYRYGWKFTSRMPDVYISRAGMENKEIDEKFTSTQLGEVESKLSEETRKRKMMEEELTSLREKELKTAKIVVEILNRLEKRKKN